MQRNFPALRKTIRTCCLILLASLPCIYIGCSKSSHSSPSPSASFNSMDHEFITDASFNNYDEINASKLTATQSSDSEVMTFGHDMVNDHRKAESELGSIADSFKVPIPAEPDSVHKIKINKLMGQSGKVFDTTYIRAMINDNQGAISLYQKELNTGHTARLQQFASKYLPMIQRHLVVADSIMQIMQLH